MIPKFREMSRQSFPVQHAFIVQADGSKVPAEAAINDAAWVQGEFITV